MAIRRARRKNARLVQVKITVLLCEWVNEQFPADGLNLALSQRPLEVINTNRLDFGHGVEPQINDIFLDARPAGIKNTIFASYFNPPDHKK